MSATTSDAMLRTRFVCYLYSFFLYRSSSSSSSSTPSSSSSTMMMMMMMGIPRCKRMAEGWYSTFGTRERSCWYMCVSCPVLMTLLLKWNVCCVGVVYYIETWEKTDRTRERASERWRRTYGEKYKHARTTLAPIIGRFHSVLLTSHRCARSEGWGKKPRKEEVDMFFHDILFSLSLSLSYTHLLSATLFSSLYAHTCLIIVTSSIDTLYMLFLMGNLITCVCVCARSLASRKRKKKKEKHTFNRTFLAVLSHIAHVCCSIDK